eukprot:scaffold309028_cov42-Prasinocladus_malaysianus.AAC.1
MARGTGATGPGAVKSADPDRVTRTIHVGGIPMDVVSEDQLADYFRHVGEVIAVRKSGRFAWVEFESVKAANQALGLDGESLGNSTLRISQSKTPIHTAGWRKGGAGPGPVGGSAVATPPPAVPSQPYAAQVPMASPPPYGASAPMPYSQPYQPPPQQQWGTPPPGPPPPPQQGPGPGPGYGYAAPPPPEVHGSTITMHQESMCRCCYHSLLVTWAYGALIIIYLLFCHARNGQPLVTCVVPDFAMASAGVQACLNIALPSCTGPPPPGPQYGGVPSPNLGPGPGLSPGPGPGPGPGLQYGGPPPGNYPGPPAPPPPGPPPGSQGYMNY